MLSKEEILATIPKLQRRTVHVKEWGGDVLIRELTGAEREDVETRLLKAQKTNDFRGIRTRMLMYCLIKEDGNPLFDEKKDTQLLNSLSASALETLFQECSRISGINMGEEGNDSEIDLQENAGLS